MVVRDEGAVSPHRMRSIVGESPTERLEQITELPLAALALRVLSRYETFLGYSDVSTSELERRVLSGETFPAPNELGDCVFDLLREIGTDARVLSFFRLLVV